MPTGQSRPLPNIADPVHYVAYGTPGGEYASTCRAATVTSVGAWVDLKTTPCAPPEWPIDRTYREVLQEWQPDTLALCVMNPTGLFLNERVPCHHGRSVEGSVDPISGVFPGGTWHHPDQCRGDQP